MTDDLSAPYFAASPDTGLTLLSRRFWDAATQAEQRAGALRAAASSAGMERIQERFVTARRAATRGGDSCFTAAAAAKETSRACAAFHRSTPTPDAVAAARADLDAAIEAVRQAALADRPTAALCETRDAADRHWTDLRDRRRQAIAELERALNRVLERLRSRPGRAPDYGGGRPRVPGTPAPTPPNRGVPMPMPAVPGTPPQTHVASGGGSSADTLAQVLAAASKPALAAQMPMQQMPQAMPAMQMPAMPQVQPQQSAPAPVPASLMSGLSGGRGGKGEPGTLLAARATPEGALPPGVGSEKGLQRDTILISRAISAAFPEIRDIGGVRADSLKWHPNGLAIDVMIPNPNSAEGKALGDRVLAFAMQYASKYGLNHAIWRQTMYTQGGAPRGMEDRGGPTANHMDHVHIATDGGGYPSGQETYDL